MTPKTPANPFETPVHGPRKKSIWPHSTSVRAEAWRGAKFGAKILGIVMAILVLGTGIFALVMVINALVITDGEYLNEIKVTEVAQQILFGILSVVGMAIWGGLIGAVIMGSAALVRKMRKTNPPNSRMDNNNS